MTTVKFDILLLKAATFSMKKDDFRLALNGIHCNLAYRNLEATNGHLAFLSKPNSVTVDNTENSHIKGFVIPPGMISQLLKIQCGKLPKERELTLTIDDTDLITATLNGITFSATAIQSQFPNVQRVYGLGVESVKPLCTLDYRYLKTVSDTQKVLQPLVPRESTGIIIQMGNDKSIFSLANNLAQIIVMGMRNEIAFETYQFN